MNGLSLEIFVKQEKTVARHESLGALGIRQKNRGKKVLGYVWRAAEREISFPSAAARAWFRVSCGASKALLSLNPP